MKKIPTLFRCEYQGQTCNITDQVTPGCEWVLAGEGLAFPKWDGTACMVLDGKLYARYDAKRGKIPPEGAIPCQDPDPITGHWPHWVEVTPDKPQYKWHWKAFIENNSLGVNQIDATYELIGPHFQGNPHRYPYDIFIKHNAGVYGAEFLPDRSFLGIKEFLSKYSKEGLVFWHEDGRAAKIRRDHFGFEWPIPIPDLRIIDKNSNEKV